MRRPATLNLKAKYFIEGYEIRWHGYTLDDNGQVQANFILFDEDANIVGTFAVPKEELRRREDVTYQAKKFLGMSSEEVLQMVESRGGGGGLAT
ncbi:MAG: hypothetical protein HYY84_12825 [Deltaproteobacteria bacterium]|nr:hypothetical protein [Deltaproteobacteria bacterium]